MYESFYGFNEKPFQLNADPQFYFGSRQHRRAMAFVEYGLHQSEGFIVITGDVGAGKTTLVRNLLAHLDPEQVVAGTLVSTQLDAEDTLRMVAAAFGVPTRHGAKSDVLLALETMLTSHASRGKRCLLVVDEAQNLSPRAVEELRMLSNFQVGNHSLLQSFLVGQPEFRLILQRPELNQLRQRVIAACHIGPLDAEDTQKYVEHRLKRVGWRDVPLFLPGAFDAIFAASGGIPRNINLLCDRVLLSGFLADRRVVAPEIVREVAEEIGAETRLPGTPRRRLTDLVPDRRFGASKGDVMEVEYEAGALAARQPRDGANGALDEHLGQVSQSMKNIEAALSRVERGNHATLALFRRFVDWVREREREPADQA